ncbi:MAG: hypothetical protein ACRDXC_14930 [Acidimicrobiales bacterium]
MACPVPLNLLCDAAGRATSTVTGGVLSAIAGWVVGGATWLLDELGQVITSTTTVNVEASWFLPHYKLMLTIAATVAVPMLVLAAVQAIFQQNAGVLLRAAFVHLPLAGLLTAAAVQIVQLALEATDALCTKVTTGTGGELETTFHSIGAVLSHEPLPVPTFVVTIGAFLIVMGAFLLWLELLVRAAAIYAAVFFLPLALASLLWPAVSHWCRRLTETLVALVLSKFVIVAVLSLAVGAVTAGGGYSTVLAGGALLLLASFTPFTLLRLIPLVEVGAVMQMEGARQRARAAWGRAPGSAVGFALRQAREHGAHRQTATTPSTPGRPGTGTTVDPGAPGPGGGGARPRAPLGPLGRAGTAGLSGVGGAAAVGGSAGVGGAAGVGGSAGVGGAAGVGGMGSAGKALGSGGGPGSGGTGDPKNRPSSHPERERGGVPAVWGGVADSSSGGGVDDGGDLGPTGTGGGAAPLEPGPTPREWFFPEAAAPPPGTIPIWPGSPESVIAALEATRRPHRVEPDGYGGIIPGVASPLWGGTEPLGRFEPGPKDDWGAWDVEGDDAGSPPTAPSSYPHEAVPLVDWPSEQHDAHGGGE